MGCGGCNGEGEDVRVVVDAVTAGRAGMSVTGALLMNFAVQSSFLGRASLGGKQSKETVHSGASASDPYIIDHAPIRSIINPPGTPGAKRCSGCDSCPAACTRTKIAPYHLEEQAMQPLPASRFDNTWRGGSASPSQRRRSHQQPPPGALEMLGGI